MKYTIKDKDKNKTIEYIIRVVLGFSKRMFRKAKWSQGIFLNGKEAKSTKRVNVGDILEIKINNDIEKFHKPEQIDFKIIYEDKCFLAINKEPRLVVHPTKQHPDKTLANAVSNYYDIKKINSPIRFINRLDKETSGVILLAKSGHAQHIVSKHKIQKEYIAIVDGTVKQNQGIIDYPISRKPDSIIEREINEKGKPAVTHYKVIKRLKNVTILKVFLITGRTHQIRVHLKAIGHPVTSDTLYGSKSSLINRTALHSSIFRFYHPEKKKSVKLIAAIPEDMKGLIKSDIT